MPDKETIQAVKICRSQQKRLDYLTNYKQKLSHFLVQTKISLVLLVNGLLVSVQERFQHPKLVSLKCLVEAT